LRLFVGFAPDRLGAQFTRERAAVLRDRVLYGLALARKCNGVRLARADDQRGKHDTQRRGSECRDRQGYERGTPLQQSL